MGAARFPALLNANSEIAANKVREKVGIPFLVPQSSAIATIASLPVEQSLTFRDLMIASIIGLRSPPLLPLSSKQRRQGLIDSRSETMKLKKVTAALPPLYFCEGRRKIFCFSRKNKISKNHLSEL
jgi:hypothetical protein